MLNEGLEALPDDTNCGVFQKSGVEEVTLQSTLRQIGRNAFKWCDGLTVYVKSGCRADLSRLDLPSSVKIVRQ